MKPKPLLPSHFMVKIAGITLSIYSDLPSTEKTFAPKFQAFSCDDGTGDEITIHHHCGLPKKRDWGEKVYHRPPWIIYKTSSHYLYRMFVDGNNESPLVSLFNKDHTEGHIYKGENYVKTFKQGNLTSLLCFPTDQILFARLLAERGGIIIMGVDSSLREKATFLSVILRPVSLP